MAKLDKDPARNRPIRYEEFSKQLDEVGAGNMQEVQLSADESIWIRLGNGIDAPDQDEFMERIQAAEGSRETAIIVLDYHAGTTGEQQLELFEKHGGTPDRLAALWAAATRDQAERLGKLRIKRR